MEAQIKKICSDQGLIVEKVEVLGTVMILHPLGPIPSESSVLRGLRDKILSLDGSLRYITLGLEEDVLGS